MNLPRKPLTDIFIRKFAKDISIPYFRGVYMSDTLPKSGSRRNESAVINLDKNSGLGTHWVAYKKKGNLVVYFDSFGDLPPPPSLVVYLESGRSPVRKLVYNHKRYQNFNTVWCGHLCLQFLTSYDI